MAWLVNNKTFTFAWSTKAFRCGLLTKDGSRIPEFGATHTPFLLFVPNKKKTLSLLYGGVVAWWRGFDLACRIAAARPLPSPRVPAGNDRTGSARKTEIREQPPPSPSFHPPSSRLRCAPEAASGGARSPGFCCNRTLLTLFGFRNESCCGYLKAAKPKITAKQSTAPLHSIGGFGL